MVIKIFDKHAWLTGTKPHPNAFPYRFFSPVIPSWYESWGMYFEDLENVMEFLEDYEGDAALVYNAELGNIEIRID